MKSSRSKSALTILLGQLLALAVLGYGLDLRCVFDSEGCQEISCCVDCSVPVHLADKVDHNSTHYKTSPALLPFSSLKLSFTSFLPTGEVSFLESEEHFRSSPSSRAIPPRGPPTLFSA
jgi:hypothetical protein